MTHRMFKRIAAALLMWLPAFAFALNDDQVRGEIVSVDADADEIEVRITEAGDNRSVSAGATQTYEIPDDVDIEYDVDGIIYAPYRRADVEIGDLERGDTVLIDFEEIDDADRRAARRVRNENTSNVAVRDRVQREGRQVEDAESQTELAQAEFSDRDRLPDTASLLPLLFVSGLLFAGLAGVFRRVRRS